MCWSLHVQGRDRRKSVDLLRKMRLTHFEITVSVSVQASASMTVARTVAKYDFDHIQKKIAPTKMKHLFVCKPSERGDEIATIGDVVPENKE